MSRVLVMFLFGFVYALTACHPKQRDVGGDGEAVDSSAIVTDTLVAVPDSIAVDTVGTTKIPAVGSQPNKIDIWEPGLFDSIPRYSQRRPFKMDPYPDIIKRYEDDAFVYSENIKSRVGVLQRVVSRISKWLSDLMPDNPLRFEKEFGYLFAFLALIVLAYILYKVLYNKNSYFITHKPEDEELDTVSYVERNLMNSNLDHYIKESIEQKNYALGVRYLQLQNIQKLAQTGHIIWKHSKTNAEFANEITNDGLRTGFLDCTQVFDRVWFGQFGLSETEFNQYRELFYQYQNQIK